MFFLQKNKKIKVQDKIYKIGKHDDWNLIRVYTFFRKFAKIYFYRVYSELLLS